MRRNRAPCAAYQRMRVVTSVLLARRLLMLIPAPHPRLPSPDTPASWTPSAPMRRGTRQTTRFAHCHTHGTTPPAMRTRFQVVRTRTGQVVVMETEFGEHVAQVADAGQRRAQQVAQQRERLQLRDGLGLYVLRSRRLRAPRPRTRPRSHRGVSDRSLDQRQDSNGAQRTMVCRLSQAHGGLRSDRGRHHQ